MGDQGAIRVSSVDIKDSLTQWLAKTDQDIR